MNRKMLVIAVAMAIAMLVVASIAPLCAASDVGRDMENEYGVITDPATVNRVTEITSRVATVAGLRGWSVKTLNMTNKNNQSVEELNAFALPDGRVYVTGGLVKAANDHAIALIMGHEIAHVVKRHSSNQMTGNLLGIAFGWVFAQLAGVKSDAALGNYMGAGGELFAAKYSRKDEYEADKLGLEYAFKAGYDPNKATSAMKLLLDRYGRGDAGIPVLGLIASHPDTKNRLMALEKQAKTLQPTTSLVNSAGFGVNAMAGGTTSPTINPRQKGTIPNIRISEVVCEIHNADGVLAQEAKTVLTSGLQQAGIPFVGRGASLDATRREKNMEDADPRTQLNKKGVWMATGSLEYEIYVTKRYTRFGVSHDLWDYGTLQIGDVVNAEVKGYSRFVSTETTEIKPTTVTSAAHTTIDAAAAYLRKWGVVVSIQGQAEKLVKDTVLETTEKTITAILAIADQIPSQDGPGLTPVVGTPAPPTITAPPSTAGAANSPYSAWTRKNGSIVAIFDAKGMVWKSPSQEFTWLEDDRLRSISPSLAEGIMKMGKK